jgi:hypothetical protein
MRIAAALLALLLGACASAPPAVRPPATLAVPGAQDDLVFTDHAMRSEALALRAEGSGWIADVPAAAAPHPAALSVSAWVWSDRPASTFFKLEGSPGREALSAFHSGNSRWEYLTAVYPYDDVPARLRITMQGAEGSARIEDLRAVATYDDRFDKALPDACYPLRERVTYRHGTRTRIVVVGNSTVNGRAVSDKRASFPYLLQLKLEAAFPGRYEVMNFGLCGWHLPPQVLTLDRLFNGNKACDGATWCGGKDAQLSPANALVPEHNADHNTPTIAQLDPDVIVFAGMWNDGWRALKYADWGIPPNPDEVNGDGAEPASVAWLRALFAYADAPGPATRKAAEAQFANAMRPLDAATLAALRFEDLASLRTSPAFARLAANARAKVGFLAGEFVRRARRHARVWTLTLPSRFGDDYEEAARRMAAAGLVQPDHREKAAMNGYIDALVSRIQDEAVEDAAREFHAPHAALSRDYRGEYGALGVAAQLRLGYFLENVEDNVHYTYRGNEWIADRAFLAFLDELNEFGKDSDPAAGFRDRR